MPNRLLTKDEFPAACAEQARVWREQWAEAMREAPSVPYRPMCHHCWHMPPEWKGSTLQGAVSRRCCWCGQNEGPKHGPYARQGDR